ncbi:bile acid:sodium symporter [Streptomyces sp. So13.3]|uniref:bile acid:sodium symporter family protein n=2 Tax=Streptomyces TaxID=1883 RepID=UPI0011074AFC|nr:MULTISPECIES: bile acid:sodium symporter family protein [unclassified Streptomyces]MCZ4102194.1 bile acid:sodium symporter [Streptomyces sp. H39-C1]QNA77633.1 bile acid:sodium symporter [Streptomyces sp. So13.3]
MPGSAPPTAAASRSVWTTLLRIDPYIAALIATVGCAALFPATGAAVAPAGAAANAAITALFFLYGARLSSQEAAAGVRHWRLHLTIIASTFIVFPLLGVGARFLVPYVIAPQLYPGLLYVCLLPSTVQSSIAFTSIARGNVAAAICAGTYSSLLGMIATPLLATTLLGSAATFAPDRLIAVATQLLLPFLAGHLLRPWIGTFINRQHTALRLVDRGSVLLVVYTAFSQGTAQGVWHQTAPLRLLTLLAVEVVLLALVLTVTGIGATALGFGRADRIAIVFAGSKKSLVNGLPMASILFGAQAAVAVLPLMMFHQMQLMVCAVIARRWSRHPIEASQQERNAPSVSAK